MFLHFHRLTNLCFVCLFDTFHLIVLLYLECSKISSASTIGKTRSD